MSGGWAAMTAINWTRGREEGGRREFSSINMKYSPPFSGQIGINMRDRLLPNTNFAKRRFLKNPSQAMDLLLEHFWTKYSYP